MSELIRPEQVDRILLFAAIAGPLVGLIVGIMVGAHRRCSLPTIVSGALLGGLCSIAYGLWRLYNSIVGVVGLDSVANAAVQVALFAVFGCILGVAAYRLSVSFHELNSRNPG